MKSSIVCTMYNYNQFHTSANGLNLVSFVCLSPIDDLLSTAAESAHDIPFTKLDDVPA